MNLTPQQQQDLFDIANEMAVELRCFLLDTIGGGPQTDHTRALVYRFMAMSAHIETTREKLHDHTLDHPQHP